MHCKNHDNRNMLVGFNYFNDNFLILTNHVELLKVYNSVCDFVARFYLSSGLQAWFVMSAFGSVLQAILSITCYYCATN